MVEAKSWVTFELTVAGMQLLAAYVSELVRQGVTFVLRQDKFTTDVGLTGGY